jgi:diguanylate cyclase (GGDEF)-like protein
VAGGDVSAREVIVVADDDPDISSHLEMTLRHEGYQVFVASDGSEVLNLTRTVHPDLVLLDVDMPEVSGYDACRELRSHAQTATTPIIMVTGHSETPELVEGLDAGADDYLAKPFHTSELLARVRSVLRRSQQLRATSPLTGLPGNERITTELDRLTADPAAEFALAYADLDYFKAYNDHYGFLRGDDVIRFTAQTLTDALPAATAGSDGPQFTGHIGGDDFVVIMPVASIDAVSTAVITAFDAGIASLYDAADRERGWLEVPDRRGDLHRFPIMTISIGVASTTVRRLTSAAHASSVATEMKSVAKKRTGSNYVVDRRRA